MLKDLVRTIFGTRHDREVKRLLPLVEQQVAGDAERLKATAAAD